MLPLPTKQTDPVNQPLDILALELHSGGIDIISCVNYDCNNSNNLAKMFRRHELSTNAAYVATNETI